MKAPPVYTPLDLPGKIALVAGATRGAGRGIAIALGEAGHCRKSGSHRACGGEKAGRGHQTAAQTPGHSGQ